MRRLLPAIALAAMVVVAPAVASAAPIQINFSVASSIGGPVTGNGFVVTDSAHLAPSAFTVTFADLIAMSMTLVGIPDVPATTTFTDANLTDPDLSWLLSIDAGGNIVDLNFFMRLDGTNIDGYSIEGTSPFHFDLCDGTANANVCTGGTPNARRDALVLSVTSVGAPQVPEPASMLLLGSGLAGVAARVRRRRKP